MEEKKKTSAAHMKATAKWEKNNYDKVLVRFPKGLKDDIKQYSDSVNGFIVEAVKKELWHREIQAELEKPCNPDEMPFH